MEQKTHPLRLAMKACLEIADYAASGISNRRELMATGYSGLSPSAYEAALDVFGQKNAAIVIACVLQRAQTSILPAATCGHCPERPGQGGPSGRC